VLNSDNIGKLKKSVYISLITSLLVIFFSSRALAQYTEFGGGLGMLSYTGDLNPKLRLKGWRPGLNAFYRMNVNNVVSVRLGLTAGKIRGDDQQAVDILGTNRDYSFDITLIEGSSVFEYYFLDYKHPHTNVYFSPYFFAGFGIFRTFGYDEARADFSKLQPVIPFGVGIKQLVGKRYAVGLEFGLRKTFFDYLDSTSDGDITLKNYQYGNPESKDWYYFAGFSITYILYEIPCPFRYVPNRYEYN
jgi:hypothetical protein